MIRTLSAFLAFALSAAPALAAERSYSVADFDRIQVEGPYEVTLVTGRSSAARAVGAADSLDRVSVEVQGRTLKIRPNRSAWGGYPGDTPGPVRIEAATRDLVAATLLGAGSLSIDKVRGLRVDLTVSGPGRVSVNRLEADNLILALTGAGRIVAAGNAKQVRASVRGSGDLDSSGLVADDALVAAETTGSVSLSARRTARIHANGLGDVTIGGTAACTVDGPAADRVRCGG